MKRIVQFSGGLCSYFAASRVVERFGPEDVTLLFADTLMESAGLYRFALHASVSLGVSITPIMDGRDIWQVFKDEKFLGNLFSLIRRGVMGTFHSVSRKHLPNYLNEFQFRWNTRKMNDGQRVVAAIKQIDGKRLEYRESVDNPPYLVQMNPKAVQLNADF